MQNSRVNGSHQNRFIKTLDPVLGYKGQWKCLIAIPSLLLLVYRNPLNKQASSSSVTLFDNTRQPCGRIMWTLILFLMIAGTVQSKCLVVDKRGRLVVLTVLPAGVYYYSDKDQLECFESKACEKWIISGCTEVLCTTDNACEGTNFVDNLSVVCESYESCRGSQIHQVQNNDSANQKCDGKAAGHPCSHNDAIETNYKLLCSGPVSCVAEDEDHPMKVNVGVTGQVVCGNLGSKEPACKNMLIQVRHAGRACFENDADTDRGCAVVCYNEWDCDKDSIRFVVQ